MSYILPIIWLYIMAVVGNTGGMYQRETVLGSRERRATKKYALMIILPLIILAAFRSKNTGDTGMYVNDFWSIPSMLSGKLAYIRSQTKDTGFYAMSALVSVFVGKHFRYYLLLLALVQGLSLMRLYRRHSEDYWLAMFVFVATTDYLSWMHNGIRQFFAVAITLCAAEPIFRRRYIKAGIIIAFASLFHQSALMMIPIMFIVQGEPWNGKTLLVIAGTVLIMAFSGVFSDTLDTVLAQTQYRNVVSDWRSSGDDGANPLRVLVYSVPALLSLLCRKQIAHTKDRVILVACNMSIVAMALYLVSMVTSGIYIGRLPIYCSLYANGILLPWELKHVFGKNMRLAAIGCYLAFYFLQVLFF